MYYLPQAELTTSRIFQGDVFEEFPCFLLPSTDFQFLREEEGEGVVYREQELPVGWLEEENLVVRARRFKIIVVSQSCDIHEEGRRNLRLGDDENFDYPTILYAPLIPLTDLAQYGRLANRVEDLRKQNVAGAFYLPAHPAATLAESVALFSWICSIRKSRENRFNTFDPKRKLASLASPYREAFAQKFAHLIGRVALPSPNLKFRGE
jgi:hypothetical protein